MLETAMSATRRAKPVHDRSYIGGPDHIALVHIRAQEFMILEEVHDACH